MMFEHEGGTPSRVASRDAGIDSEARLRAIYDGTSTYIGLIAPDGTLLDCNAASLEFAGSRREDVIGMPFWETPWFAHTRGAAEHLREAIRAAAAGERVRYELPLVRPDGDVLVFDFSLHPVRDASGAVVYIVPEGRDVTDRFRVEVEREHLVAALSAEQARLRALILRMPAPVALLVGREHRHELVNDAFRRISGGGRDVTGLTVREAFPELAGQGIFERLDRVFSSGERWAAPESLVRYDRDGTGIMDCWFDVRFEPLLDPSGRVVGILNFAVDVTEQVTARRAMERLLEDSELARAEAEAASERTEALLASIGDPFYLLDNEWRFTYVNDAAEPLLQATRDELLGRTLWEAFPGVIGSVFEGPYREAMATRRPTSAEAYFAPLGTWFDVHTYAWAGGLMVHFRDIGARKAAEAERERLLADAQLARTEAEVANRVKAEFLATMSHELRTPLNAIGGYAELIEMGIRGPVTPAQLEDLRRIQASQRHLLGLVNEVLNYARIETGTVRYDVAVVPVAWLVTAVEPLIAPLVARKGLRFGSDSCRTSQIAVRADGEKVLQVLLNLLSNAVKFTDSRGAVTITCEADGDTVLLRVTDTGIGIAPDELERVFEPFVQVDARLTRTHEGTGLGLAISRDLARGMGGDLRARSTPGVGSTFTLMLPRAT